MRRIFRLSWSIDMKEIFNCFIEVRSPLHLGCDEVYEPTGFIVDEGKQQMIVFDPIHFISRMNPDDKQRFSELCMDGRISSLLEIYKFLNIKKADGRIVDVCPGFIKHHQKTLSIPTHNEKTVREELNGFIINRTSFKPYDQRPYIPGSAVKGAIRTAYLNHITTGKKLPPQRGAGAARKLEIRLMEGQFETDPFRMVKVSDFMPEGKVPTKIVYAVNEKKNRSQFDAKGPYQILEIIKPGAVFSGEITVETPHKDAGIQTPVKMEALKQSLLDFFINEKEREDKELQGIGINGFPVSNTLEELPIRIGRHSGAECITIDGHRDIRIMTNNSRNPKFMDHATTLWLAADTSKPVNKSGLLPFGWATLKEMTQEKQGILRDLESDWVLLSARKKEIKQIADAELKAQKIREAECQRQQEMKAKQQQKLEKKRQAELDAMSPEQMDIEAFDDEDVPENTIVEIYYRIDGYSEDYQQKIGDKLKKYWMANNKWTKKFCSKKQWEKVKKIKNILGEF